MGIIGFDFKSLKDKIENSLLLLHQTKRKKRGKQFGDPVACILRAF